MTKLTLVQLYSIWRKEVDINEQVEQNLPDDLTLISPQTAFVLQQYFAEGRRIRDLLEQQITIAMMIEEAEAQGVLEKPAGPKAQC